MSIWARARIRKSMRGRRSWNRLANQGTGKQGRTGAPDLGVDPHTLTSAGLFIVAHSGQGDCRISSSFIQTKILKSYYYCFRIVDPVSCSGSVVRTATVIMINI